MSLSPKMQRLGRSLLPVMDALLAQWAGALQDRRTPLPPAVVARLDSLLGEARRVLSRESAVRTLQALDPARPVTPTDAFVALLQARTLLAETLAAS